MAPGQTDVPPLETIAPGHRSACWRFADVVPLVGERHLEAAVTA